MTEKPRDPTTGIFFIKDWGPSCYRGFVSSSGFAKPGEQVIARTNRKATRKWRDKLEQEQKENEGE